MPRLTPVLLLVVFALARPAAADTTTTPPTTTAPTTTPATKTCVPAPPRVAGLARATVASTCGARDGVVHEGDSISVQALGHFRLEAELDTGNRLEVTCVGAGTPLVATISGEEAPWFRVDGDVRCGAWTKNEQVCATSAGQEVLVCDAATQRPTSLVARPLGIPAWYVGELPTTSTETPTTTPATTTTTTTTTTPPTTPATTTTTTPTRLLRVVVQEPAGAGMAERVLPVFTRSLTAELRKLRGVTVVSMDELRALIAQEGDRQLAGCTEESCLGEIANALGADVIVTAQLGETGDEQSVALRRLSTGDGKSVAFDLHFARGNGEGFLGAIGPGVEQLFADHGLLPGQSRGVDKEAAYLLNPPPVPPWAWFSVVGAGVATAAVAGGVGLFTASEVSRIDERLQQSTSAVVDGGGLVADHERAVNASVVAWSAAGAAGAIFVAAAVLIPFTDFAGHQELEP